MRRIKVVKYKPVWQKKFIKEKTKLYNIFADEIKEIHHIGSTSINGLSAKPIIDILIIEERAGSVANRILDLKKLGYTYVVDNSISGRCFFYKGKNKRKFHLHIFEPDSPHIRRHIAFAEYLKENDNDRKRYEEIKIEAADKCGNDIDKYMSIKKGIVKEIEKRAIEWYEATLI